MSETKRKCFPVDLLVSEGKYTAITLTETPLNKVHFHYRAYGSYKREVIYCSLSVNPVRPLINCRSVVVKPSDEQHS